jgi:hypothetical protein
MCREAEEEDEDHFLSEHPFTYQELRQKIYDKLAHAMLPDSHPHSHPHPHSHLHHSDPSKANTTLLDDSASQLLIDPNKRRNNKD